MSTLSEPFLQFESIYQTRVWGGRALAEKLGRHLPDEESPFGEAWELSAREEADSVVCSGALAGKTLSELWGDPVLKKQIFGEAAPEGKRFPLLCKILDARDKLSIQVHPPSSVADELEGEPKTEVWYIAKAEPGSMLYVGVKEGVTSDSFRAAMENGTAEDCVHAIPVSEGQHIFIPSGRLHAIGAGLLIYEMQQNSDTTYRVYDWNRTGLDGQPRDLHVEESMRCIDFSDVEPGMDQPEGTLLCECEHFRLERHPLGSGESLEAPIHQRFAVVTVLEGEVLAAGKRWKEGDFFLVPAAANGDLPKAGRQGAKVLVTTW